MQDEQQFEQLMLQYTQLKNGAQDIAVMIEKEDFDNAITMVKAREHVFLNCKCMLKFLELTPEQQEAVDKIVEEIRELELKNIEQLQHNMDEVQVELAKAQLSQKIHKVYGGHAYESSGSMINFEE